MTGILARSPGLGGLYLAGSRFPMRSKNSAVSLAGVDGSIIEEEKVSVGKQDDCKAEEYDERPTKSADMTMSSPLNGWVCRLLLKRKQ